MFNADENKEMARVMIEKYLSNLYNRNFFLNREELMTILEYAVNPEKGKIPAIKFLRWLSREEIDNWNPSGYANNQFEEFVREQKSIPAQTPYYWVGLKEAKDIVDWLVAQKDWFS